MHLTHRVGVYYLIPHRRYYIIVITLNYNRNDHETTA